MTQGCFFLDTTIRFLVLFKTIPAIERNKTIYFIHFEMSNVVKKIRVFINTRIYNMKTIHYKCIFGLKQTPKF